MKPTHKQSAINRPILKAFIGGVITAIACNLSLPLSQQLEMRSEHSMTIAWTQLLLHLGILLGTIWLSNLILDRFGFEGFKRHENWGLSAFFSYVLGFILFVCFSATFFAFWRT